MSTARTLPLSVFGQLQKGARWIIDRGGAGATNLMPEEGIPPRSSSCWREAARGASIYHLSISGSGRQIVPAADVTIAQKMLMGPTGSIVQLRLLSNLDLTEYQVQVVRGCVFLFFFASAWSDSLLAAFVSNEHVRIKGAAPAALLRVLKARPRLARSQGLHTLTHLYHLYHRAQTGLCRRSGPGCVRRQFPRSRLGRWRGASWGGSR